MSGVSYGSGVITRDGDPGGGVRLRDLAGVSKKLHPPDGQRVLVGRTHRAGREQKGDRWPV
jgi:hypothetical protein